MALILEMLLEKKNYPQTKLLWLHRQLPQCINKIHPTELL